MRGFVGRNLEDMIERSGKTKKQLAEYLGVSGAIITMWCKDQCQIRDKHYQQICDFLGRSLSDLLIDKDNSDLLFPVVKPIPILGSICAGNGIICEEDYQGKFYIDSSVQADFCLKVKGDSMFPIVNDGDIAFIRKEFEFVNADTYAVYIDGDVVLKKVYKQEDSIMLVSNNNLYAPIITSEALILGKCIGHYSSL